jgi:hypothetical protein
MKKLFFTATLLTNLICSAQFSGNINYRTINDFTQNSINVNSPKEGEISLTVKGLANVKADQYVAIFSITQTGKNQVEANQIIDERIAESLKQIKLQKNVETFTDMISFVPLYEFTSEKKIFSKRTYNEIPKGFEIKKNIHIKFSDPEQLSNFIKLMAQNEIYDLVRVDYYLTTLDSVKKEVVYKGKSMLAEKMKSYEELSGKTFANDEKSFSEGFITKFPMEMYKSYEAYNSNSLDVNQDRNVNQIAKNSTIYYQSIFDQNFDFVINPVVLEPVIQVMFEVKVTIQMKKNVNNQYMVITPNGEMKTLKIEK